MPVEVRAQVDRAADRLREAMRKRDLDAVSTAAAGMRQALGDFAGVPEHKPEFRAKPDTKTEWNHQRMAALWERAWEQAEADYTPSGRWGLPKSEHPEVQHALLRHTAYSIMGGLAALKHDLGNRNLIRRRVEDGLAYLRSVQRPNGLFPFPDARNWSKHFGPPLQSLYDQHPDAFVDGWVIDDYGDGGLQFDNGVCAAAMITAFEELGDQRCRDAARRSCEWTLDRPIVVNWNYNAFTVWSLACYIRVTGEQRFLAPAVERVRLGVLPGQLPTGRWLDPHNARTVYHAIILRALAELYAVLPADESIRPQLREAIERAERALVDEILTQGPTDADHSLSALCAVERVFGQQPRRSDAIRAIINAMYVQLVEPREKVLDDLTLFAVRQTIEHMP